MQINRLNNTFVWFSNGAGFNPSVPWEGGEGLDKTYFLGSSDFDGDGRLDLLQLYPAGNARVWLSKPPSDLLKEITNPMGGTFKIAYKPSSAYQNTLMPFVLQTVESVSSDDGRGNVSSVSYSYEGGLYDAAERDFCGFRKVTASTSEATVETWFHQDAVKHGKVEKVITISQDGHHRQIGNTYETRDLDGGAKFPALVSTTTTVTDAGAAPFTITNTLEYDSYLNIKSNTTSGTDSETVTIETEYAQFERPWIVAKPKMVTVKNAAGQIMSRKWMDYDSSTGNLVLEEVCKSDDPNLGCLSRNSNQNPKVSYTYYPEGNVQTITDPLGNVTTFTYDATKTYLYERINALGHTTTTVYDNGKLVTMVPPICRGLPRVSLTPMILWGARTQKPGPMGDGPCTLITTWVPPQGSIFSSKSTLSGVLRSMLI